MKRMWILNIILWILCIARCRTWAEGVLNCLLTTVLLFVSLSDAENYTIPMSCSVYVLILGILKMILLRGRFVEAALGMLAAGIPLLFLYCISRGRAIGGGDVKLMMAAGVYLGNRTLIAIFAGCLTAVILHPLRMKFQGIPSKVAFGPYLSLGIWMTAVVLA